MSDERIIRVLSERPGRTNRNGDVFFVPVTGNEGVFFPNLDAARQHILRTGRQVGKSYSLLALEQMLLASKHMVEVDPRPALSRRDIARFSEFQMIADVMLGVQQQRVGNWMVTEFIE